ncbi:Lrp/AsnC family transcriptional regulator [Xanthomonas campestris]|uniref:Lrp/AsnC family transcriptional regulator n=1 Tax=Xanthomonas euroxanthea TaxID=2259622 RepID=UPI00182A1CBD|nr:Lrp/AsnC family transcriptional regulator [Xanthomonas euroxanthea]MBB3777793.1 Lrp/AsnC family transcriptional regulator [Xanthomonas euroxanthea]
MHFFALISEEMHGRCAQPGTSAIQMQRCTMCASAFANPATMLTSRDLAILNIMQLDSDTPLIELGEAVHLSPSACSRRLTQLREAGYIRGNVAVLDRLKIGLPTTTTFVMIGTSQHNDEWTAKFHAALTEIPEIVDAYRLTGNVDYILKIVLPAVEDYDRVYKTLIRKVDMTRVSAYISMETVTSSQTLPLVAIKTKGDR